jgi:hypothetical protein
VESYFSPLTRRKRIERFVLFDLSSHFKVRPHALHFAYEALFPGFDITQIGHWKNWRPGSQKTWAKGWLHYDTCKPDCAEGCYVRHYARVPLSDSSHLCDGRSRHRRD